MADNLISYKQQTLLLSDSETRLNEIKEQERKEDPGKTFLQSIASVVDSDTVSLTDLDIRVGFATPLVLACWSVCAIIVLVRVLRWRFEEIGYTYVEYEGQAMACHVDNDRTGDDSLFDQDQTMHKQGFMTHDQCRDICNTQPYCAAYAVQEHDPVFGLDDIVAVTRERLFDGSNPRLFYRDGKVAKQPKGPWLTPHVDPPAEMLKHPEFPTDTAGRGVVLAGNNVDLVVVSGEKEHVWTFPNPWLGRVRPLSWGEGMAVKFKMNGKPSDPPPEGEFRIRRLVASKVQLSTGHTFQNPMRCCTYTSFLEPQREEAGMCAEQTTDRAANIIDAESQYPMCVDKCMQNKDCAGLHFNPATKECAQFRRCTRSDAGTQTHVRLLKRDFVTYRKAY